jgi:hypothetical protein
LRWKRQCGVPFSYEERQKKQEHLPSVVRIPPLKKTECLF